MVTKEEKEAFKKSFREVLVKFVETLREMVSGEDGQWNVKGFIDIFKNVYTISSDTKIVSKILEIHLFPHLLAFANAHHYKIVLAEKQNWYPDLTFVKIDDSRVKFAVDLKTTYRDPIYKGHVNGFTLGSRGEYFSNRTSTKNIQYPYSEYLGHYCLGIIYTRTDYTALEEVKIYTIEELEEKGNIQPNTPKLIGEREITNVGDLKSIVSVIKDFDFFVTEKWQLASDKLGSHNTQNIGSITFIEDVKAGNGIFAKLGEEVFDEYWINYNNIERVILDGNKNTITKKINNLKDYLEFTNRDTQNINPIKTKKKPKKNEVTEEANEDDIINDEQE